MNNRGKGKGRFRIQRGRLYVLWIASISTKSWGSGVAHEESEKICKKIYWKYEMMGMSSLDCGRKFVGDSTVRQRCERKQRDQEFWSVIWKELVGIYRHERNDLSCWYQGECMDKMCLENWTGSHGKSKQQIRHMKQRLTHSSLQLPGLMLCSRQP